mgnify:FL=1
MKQSQFYYLLRRGLFSGGSAIIKSGLVMFNKFTTAGLSFPVQGSAAFNGTSDNLNAGNVLNQGTANATYSFWLYRKTTSVTRVVLAKTNGGSITANYGFIVLIDSTNKLNYYTSDDDNSQNRSSVDLGTSYDENWHHFVIVVDKSQDRASIYIDGSAQSVAKALGDLSAVDNVTNSVNFKIGSESDSEFFFNGNLANVAIWNRALSSDEINSVMWKPVQALSATESNGLQAWYSLDDIASPTASLASMEQLATDKDVTIENKAAITAAVNSLS